MLINAASGDSESKSSVIILDSELQIKTLPGLDGLFVSQVADRLYEGHLFALDLDQNLIAMNVKLLLSSIFSETVDAGGNVLETGASTIFSPKSATKRTGVMSASRLRS